jgi:CspA family cold shock protein
MPTGKVKWFNHAKGYGFIQPDEGGNDVFVHITALHKSDIQGLNENDSVSYDLIDGRDGRSAADNLSITSS